MKIIKKIVEVEVEVLEYTDIAAKIIGLQASDSIVFHKKDFENEDLENSALNYPDKVAFADDKTSITYKDLVAKARAYGSYLAKFVERMKTVKAAVVEDNGARAEAHTMEVPYASRETLLARLSMDLYRDAMALDTREIAGGAVTATQIKASYEPLNSKTDEFEYCIHDFLEGILALAGVEDEVATFTRSMLINKSEEIDSLMKSATNLDPEYVTRKLLTIFGDGDKADEMIEKMHQEELERMNMMLSAQNGNSEPMEQ